MTLLYRLGVALYGIGIRAAARLGHAKAQQWVSGRAGGVAGVAARWQHALQQRSAMEKTEGKPSDAASAPVLWMHCASLGEFEQGRPVLEALRAARPGLRVVLSFFSPSGYTVRKDYAGADLVCYLPEASPRAARAWVHALRPDLAVLVKYELWADYLQALHAQRTPAVLIAANLRPGRGVDGPLARRWYARVFPLLRAAFTQDEAGAEVARRLGAPHAEAAGDPRFDRVVAIADAAHADGPVPHITAWLAGRPCLVAGSVWEPDIERINAALTQLHARTGQRPAVIWAPHVTSPERARALAQRYGGCTYADLLNSAENPPSTDQCWIDRVGLLARLYQHADLCYVGGGFGVGVHNTLEAAVWGKRVLFGPKHSKFREALGLIAAGGARAVLTPEALLDELRSLVQHTPELAASGARAGAYVRTHTGATARIVQALLPLLDAERTVPPLTDGADG